MEPIVASIWDSFRQVPPAAIPPMLDCILASTAIPPSSLFSALLDEFPQLKKSITQRGETIDCKWSDYVVSYMTALLHFLKKSDACHMSSVIWKILIPLLKLSYASDRKLFNEVVGLFFDVVNETNSWEVLEPTFMPFLLRSIGLSMGMFQSEELSVFKWSENADLKDLSSKEVDPKSCDDFLDVSAHNSTPEYLLVSESYDLPLTMTCNILALTLDAALQDKQKGVLPGSTIADSLKAKLFARNTLWDLGNVTLQMLTHSLEHRSAAIKFLLPFIFKALVFDSAFRISVCGRDHVLTRNVYFTKIWNCCKLLFSIGQLERRDGYDIISLYLSFKPQSDEHEDEDVNASGRNKTFDLRADQSFWDEIKRGLLDKESLLRKQSLHILKTILNLGKEMKCSGFLEEIPDKGFTESLTMSKRGRWADMEAKSMGVGRVFNSSESSTSLQRWEAFIFLYEMLEEYGTHLVEAAWNHQILLWLQSSFSFGISKNSTNGQLYHNQMATSEGIFEWLAVLWERGFCHDNPQVRCLIMQSFLTIEWEKYRGSVKYVPKEFILGPLMQGLNDPVHHRDFGLKEIYSSWTIEATAKFLCQYASYIQEREHISFLVDLASVSKKHSFGRAGLMCLAECIASASLGVLKHNSDDRIEQSANDINDKSLVQSAAISCQNDKSDLLDILRFVIECCKQHFNPKYRHQVCSKILAAASPVMTAVDVPFEILLHFISSLPREYSDTGGPLRNVLQKWLRGPTLQLLKVIGTFPENFISCKNPSDGVVTYDDEELGAWVSEARRWARVLFLVAWEEKHFNPILKFIEDHCDCACDRNKYTGLVAVKFLILVSSLVLEFHVNHERTAKTQTTTKKKGDSVSPLPSSEESINSEKFTCLLLNFLGKLVSFTESSCSIFWSAVETKDVTLPGSISGRLGGPSQRRLPTSLCTSVLDAITSVKTLASVLRWCASYNTDVLINSAWTFLWNFCCNVIRSPLCTSELQAEMLLAAYEACTYALKDLVSVFSHPLLDNVWENDKSFPSGADGRPLLDAFVSTLIDNINNVIDGGHLARTRRAVLITWKWSCLELLLSLPSCALCGGIGSKRHNVYLSDTVVRQTFGDLLESLENAGESSVLPMLRAVRFCMELFDSEKMDPLVFSSTSVTVEMMWQLVRSSWILHVSSNKRRVAPIAALLAAVLHRSVFGNELMHDSASGPLKWFVEKILDEGTKSPRTIRLAALHLSGLWLTYPSTLKYYMKELKLLTLYGSVAFDEDFEAELTENCDARNEVAVLSRSLEPELTEVFINTELYARVSVAVLFSKLAERAILAEPTVETNDKPAALASGKMFLLELLDSVLNDKDLSKELYKKYSAIHRRKVRAWQMMCILSHFVDQDIVEQVTTSLHTSIYRNNLPSVRQYLETFAIHIYLKFPVLVEQQLVPMLRSYDLRSQALSSYVFIAANVILHANKEAQFGHLDELLPPIFPLLTSHHHTLRGFTQVLVYQVLQKLLPEPNSSSSAGLSLERKCFMDLRSYLALNPDCVRLRTSMDMYLDSFDPVRSVSPAGTFTNRVEELEFECVPTTLMDRVIEFLNDTREDLRSSMARDAASIKNDSLQVDQNHERSEILDPSGKQSVLQLPNNILHDFQKKITFSKHDLQDKASNVPLENKAFYGPLSGMDNEDQLLDQLLHSRGVIVEKLKASRQQIILIASLVDRIPNLAGLARSCEVFRVAELAIADKSILNDKQFQLISVTAEKWVPVVEVPVASVRVFLEKKKREGFSILGLEQTTNSIPLDHYKFPKKTVLVLGREKEGIPVEIIHILDACIEIPQLGVVRSLNVHVSGAIALWEYTRQQRLL